MRWVCDVLNISRRDVLIKAEGIFASKVPQGERAPTGPLTPLPAAPIPGTGAELGASGQDSLGRGRSTCWGHWEPGPAAAYCPVGEMANVTEAETYGSEGEATQDS